MDDRRYTNYPQQCPQKQSRRTADVAGWLSTLPPVRDATLKHMHYCARKYDHSGATHTRARTDEQEQANHSCESS